MNKKRFSLALVSLLCATALLAGCSSSGDDSEEKEVAAMKLSGIPTAYQTSDTINWSAVKVTVSYKDKSSEQFTGSQLQYDITSDVAESTKLVVYTSGLHAQTTLTEGEYNVQAAFAKSLTKKYSLGRIVVGKIVPDKYDLDSFEAPKFVDDINTVKTSSTQDPTADGSFKNVEELHTVGTKNLFRFVPRASFELKGGAGHSQRYTNYEKVFTLKEIKSDSSKVDAQASDYSIPEDQSGIQFNESAAGKKFELSVSPAEFPFDSNGHAAIVTFQFQVKSGLNVYEAKQLGALNLTSKSRVGSKIVAHISTPTDAQEAGRGKHYFESTVNDGNGVSRVFWDKVSGTYTRLDTAGLWKDWLLDNHVFTEEEIAKYTDLKGVFLQDRIELTKDDIPADFFVTKNETGNLNEYEDMTCLRDAAEIYLPIIDAAANKDDRSKDVEINGNYFTLDCKLPICKSNWGDAARDGFHTYGGTITSVGGTIDPGHASLFKFCGLDPDYDGYYYYQASLNPNYDPLNGAKGIIRNLNTLGLVEDIDIPDPEQRDAILSVTALIMAKNTYCSAEYNNNIIKRYQIGVFPDTMVPGVYTEGDIHYNTLIKDCRIYDCSNSAICNYENNGTLVKTSEFGRFGGSAILNAGHVDSEDNSGNYNYAKHIHHYDSSIPENSDAFKSINWSKTYVDKASSASFNNYVTGNEVYFAAVGANMFFDKVLPTYEDMFQTVGNTYRFLDETNKKVYNIKSLDLDGAGYVASNHKEWYGDVIFNYDDAPTKLRGGCADPMDASYVSYATFGANGYWIPIFTTEKGETFTSLYDPFKEQSEQPYTPKAFLTLASVQAFFLGGGTDTSLLVPQGHITGSSVSIILPADTDFGHTTINAVFEVRSLV